MRVVCFELRGQELAIPIAEVRETVPMQPITRVFLTPACLAGVFSLRGEIVPALDLAVLLGLPRTEVSDDSRIVVVACKAGTAGIVVDRMRELRTLADPLEPPPANVTPSVAALLAGVAATDTGTVRVLDTAAILTVDALSSIARAREADAEQGRSS